MQWFKKKIFVLGLLFLVYATYFFTHLPSQTTPSHVLSATSNVSLFTQPETGKHPILDAISQAHQEILVEMYLLSDKDIISSLEQAKTRGVLVEVMLEQHPFGGGNLNTKTQKELTGNGISFEWTNPRFALTHEKSIIIDGQEAFILGQNLTTSAFTKNREYDVIDTTPQDVLEIRNIFLADWERKSITLPQSHLVISPDTSRAALTALIQNATESISIEIEDINDSQIVSILSEKAKTIPVQMIVPTLTQISSNKDTLLQLQSAGVQIKTLSSPYVHAKLILVDNKKAYVGSVNLSTQSMDENRELGIIISENDTLQTLSTTFTNDWDKGILLGQ
ncbi:MAG TPA: phospholipase D-like domain-containing protein [Patescibacteria group bacterium]|nr:phospholipase D-like domain-containing protein [Patescibacteria group bacterium]